MGPADRDRQWAHSASQELPPLQLSQDASCCSCWHAAASCYPLTSKACLARVALTCSFLA